MQGTCLHTLSSWKHVYTRRQAWRSSGPEGEYWKVLVRSSVSCEVTSPCAIVSGDSSKISIVASLYELPIGSYSTFRIRKVSTHAKLQERCLVKLASLAEQ